MFPRITGDHVQLQQVLMNLMLNGIEAMKETGGVLLIKSQLDQNDKMLIGVSDTGVGLPDASLPGPRAFMPPKAFSIMKEERFILFLT